MLIICSLSACSAPEAKESSATHVLNKTAMVLYLSSDNVKKSKVTYALASDIANCMMITRPHMVDTYGMVRNQRAAGSRKMWRS